MAETSIAGGTEREQGERRRRTWGDPGIGETLRRERAHKTALANAFLDRYGRDDYLDAHHACLERRGR